MADNKSGIDAILDNIREYAQETAGKLIAESNEKAEARLTAAVNETEAETTRLEAEADAEIERLKVQAENDFNAVKRDRTLAMKQELLGSVYARTLERLTALPDDAKLALYRKWLAKYADDRSYRVVLCKSDAASFGDILADEMSRGLYPGRPALSAYSAEIAGGLILDYGDYRTDLSFESAVEGMKVKVDSELIGILFPAG